MMKYLKTNKCTFILLALLLLFPLTITITKLIINPEIAGYESYYHLLISSREGEISPSPYFLNPYDLILSIHPRTMSLFIPLILTILSGFLLHNLLKKFEIPTNLRNLSILFLLLSPFFIALAIFSSPLSLILFLNLLGITLLLNNKRNPSIIIFLLIPFFGPIHVFFTLMILGIIYLWKIRNTLLHMLSILILSILYYAILILTKKIPDMSNLSITFFTTFFTELGSYTGFTILNLILVALGLLFLWKRKRTFYLLHVLIAVGMFISIYFEETALYLLIPFQLVAAYAVLKIDEMTWDLKKLKKLSLLLIIIALVFSQLAYSVRLVNTEPIESSIKGLEWLEDEDPGNVLSHHTRGYWIEAIAKKTPILEGRRLYDDKATIEKANTIFYTRNLKKATELLQNLSVEYIFIDRAMKEGLVWKDNDQGLLFLFRNNETFKRLYKTRDVEIWYIKDGITK